MSPTNNDNDTIKIHQASPEYVIDVKSLSKSFSGKKVVNNISLQVKKGSIFGFLGPNGSGKTTTIRMVCGLLNPDEAVGTCLGYDILTESEAIKRHVGYMTQKFSLYGDLTIYENLDFIARVYRVANRKQAVKDSLDRMGISLARSRQLARNLSGGWKQRLALAASVLHHPQLLLLDEPTAGVDPKARREFWDYIHQLAGEGITVLVITHYMDEAERCHELAYIAYGNMIVHGTMQAIIDEANLMTWDVSGDSLNALATALANEPAVSQVAAFGLHLHVSGTDHNALLALKNKYQSLACDWQPIAVGLEDVFIHYMNQAQDNFA